MRTPFAAGFTIIETLLVLAVTGALVSGILLTVGASLNTQRYRDSVDSLKTTLQAQYSELGSVQNDRENNVSCNSAAQLSEDRAEVRGQSNCILLGKLVSIDRGEITFRTVLGVERAAASETNDITSLRNNYILSVSELGVDTKLLEWGTEIAWPTRVNGEDRGGASTPRQLSLLFIKSPDSGRFYTFSADTAWESPTSANLRSMVQNVESVPEKIICVDPQGLAPPEKLAIYIPGTAAVPSAIESRSNTLLGEQRSRC